MGKKQITINITKEQMFKIARLMYLATGPGAFRDNLNTVKFYEGIREILGELIEPYFDGGLYCISIDIDNQTTDNTLIIDPDIPDFVPIKPGIQFNPFDLKYG